MDKIVSTVHFEGSIYIFTEQDKVYRMFKDTVTQVAFQLISKLELR